MENQEKTEVEVKERKEWMGPGTKTALIAAGLSLISVIVLYLTSYADQITEPGGIFGVILGVIFGVIFGGILGGIFGGIFGGVSGVIFGGILGGISGVIFGVIFGGIVGGIVGGDVKDTRKQILLLVFLSIVFLLPFCSLIIPLSKYHNKNRLERDKGIVEILQIRVLEDGVEVLLPDQYVGENSYLKKVFSLGWAEENKKKWREIVVPCREGRKHWFYARLPFPEKKTAKAKLELFFDHAWQDYTTTKEVSLKQ